jgi:hypothetical protein
LEKASQHSPEIWSPLLSATDFHDTYFFSAEHARQVASQQNKKNNGYWLQCCYYDGPKLEIDLPNLIHLPIEGMVDALGNGSNRIPTRISLDGIDCTEEQRDQIRADMALQLAAAKALRLRKNQQHYEQLRNAKLDFSEPLRMWLHAHVNTTVMFNIIQCLYDACRAAGLDTQFEVKYGVEDYQCYKNMALFNPHVTFSINHFNNTHISDDVFNFVWFQDAMFAIELSENQYIRRRDIVYSLTKSIKKHLADRGIESLNQHFCVDTKKYRARKNIKRADKIVFIGSSYRPQWDLIAWGIKHEVTSILFSDLLENGYWDRDKIGAIKHEYKINDDILGRIKNYVERDLVLKQILHDYPEYRLEIYGRNWAIDPVLNSACQGPLSFGEDISKIYNGAQYALVLGGYVLQQRTLEAAASGATPIILDVRSGLDTAPEDNIDESAIFFRRPAEFGACLEKASPKVVSPIIEGLSYADLVAKMLKQIMNSMSTRWYNS